MQERGLSAYLAELIGTFLLVFFITSVVTLYVSIGSSAQFGTDYAVVGLVQGFFLAEPAEPWSEPAGIRELRTPTPRLRHDRLHRELRAARTQRDACEAVAAHLFRHGVMPSVYLEVGGRLRCQAQRGLWQVLDGMSPDAGITGLTFRTGRAHDLSELGDSPDYLEAIPGVVAERTYRQFRADGGGSADVDAFRQFVVAQLGLTEYQAALIQRGRVDGFPGAAPVVQCSGARRNARSAAGSACSGSTPGTDV